MSSCILSATTAERRDSLRRSLAGWRARSCAALIGATTLMSLSLSGPGSTPGAAAPAQQQAQHHHDRVGRHRLRRPRALWRRRRPRHADPEHRPPGGRGHDVLLLLRPAELHARPRRHADRPHPEPQRHDHRGLPGPGRRPAGGGMDAGVGAQDRRLQDLLHRQVAPRRGRLRAAERAGLRRDEVCRPLSPQRLHLCRPDLVPGHGPGTARDVPARDQGLAVGQRRRAGARGLQDQRPVRRHAGHRRQEGVVGIPFFDGYVEKAAIDYLDAGRQVAERADLHEHQLHEGAPAEHAAPGLHP